MRLILDVWLFLILIFGVAADTFGGDFSWTGVIGCFAAAVLFPYLPQTGQDK